MLVFFVFLHICLFVCLCIYIFVFLLEITSVVREIVDGPDGGVEKGDDEDGKESQFEHNLSNTQIMVHLLEISIYLYHKSSILARNFIHNPEKCEGILTGETKHFYLKWH